MLDNMSIVNRIVDTCFEIQTRKNAALPPLESQLAQAEKEIDNVMNAIKQGIITATTKETLLKLEQEKEETEINITKAKIERPVLNKEQIEHYFYKFKGIDLNDTEQKQRLINIFLKAVYIYDDKMLIILKYKDGEICVTFDEITRAVNQKENPDNRGDYRGSPLGVGGDPKGAK